MLATPDATTEPPRPKLDVAIVVWHPQYWDLHVWMGEDGTPIVSFANPKAPGAGLHLPDEVKSPSYVNVEERRERLRTQLAERGGGPLGVEAVKEVIVGVTDLAVARGLWQKLLAPTRSSASSTWQVGDGPAIRLLQAGENTTHGLVIRVASLPKARALLRERDLLGIDSQQEATIDPSKIEGLNIRLVEKR